MSCRLLRLIEEVSESDVSHVCIERFSFPRIGVTCGADGPVDDGCVRGAAIGWRGLKCSFWEMFNLCLYALS